MSRPIWKGHISFGLVNIPVVLYSAERKSEIRFKLLDSRDKAKIRYVRINEQTGREVDWQDIAKGFEYEKGDFVLFDEKELKNIAGENIKMISIESFVNKSSINVMEYETPYYLVPEKKGEKGYVILREILESTKKVGIAKVIIHTKEYLAALMSYENALVLNLIRYAQELRKPEDFELPTEGIKKYKINNKELEVAKQLVDSMTTKWKPEDYKDEYRATVEKAIHEKVTHKHSRTKMKKRGTSSSKSNVVDFVSLLKQSMTNKNNKLKSNSKAAHMKTSSHKTIKRKKQGK